MFERFPKVTRRFFYILRRSVLGAFKLSGITSFLVYLATVYLLPERLAVLIAGNGALITGAVAGAVIDGGLARRKRFDLRLTPYWNGSTKFCKTLLLKSFAYTFFLTRNRTTANPPGLIPTAGFVTLLVAGYLVIIPLSALAGFGEFRKYSASRDLETIYVNNTNWLKKLSNRLSNGKTGKALNALTMGIDVAASAIAIIDISELSVEYVDNFFINEAIKRTLIHEVADYAKLTFVFMAGITGLSIGILNQFSSRFRHKVERPLFAMNELIQSSMFTLGMCNVLYGAELWDTVTNSHFHSHLANKIIFSTGTAFLTSLSAISHAYDAVKNKYHDKDLRLFDAYQEERGQTVSVELHESASDEHLAYQPRKSKSSISHILEILHLSSSQENLENNAHSPTHMSIVPLLSDFSPVMSHASSPEISEVENELAFVAAGAESNMGMDPTFRV